MLEFSVNSRELSAALANAEALIRTAEYPAIVQTRFEINSDNSVCLVAENSGFKASFALDAIPHEIGAVSFDLGELKNVISSMDMLLDIKHNNNALYISCGGIFNASIPELNSDHLFIGDRGSVNVTTTFLQPELKSVLTPMVKLVASLDKGEVSSSNNLIQRSVVMSFELSDAVAFRACNGHSVSWDYIKACPNGALDTICAIRGVQLGALSKMLKKGFVSATVYDNTVSFEIDNTVIEFKRVLEPVPKYLESAYYFQVDDTNNITVDRDDLLKGLRFAGNQIKGDKNYCVSLVLDDRILTIRACNSKREVAYNLCASGKQVKSVYMNANELYSRLQHAPSGNLRMSYTNEISVLRITPIDYDAVPKYSPVYYVLPVRYDSTH